MDRQVREALEAVYERPHDDDRRRVAGDCLLDRGHPWGALIAAQLGPPSGGPPSADEERIAAEAAPRAFGRLWPLVVPGSYRLERGFPTECRLLPIAPSSLDLEEILTRPEWATLERVAFDDERGTSGRPQHALSLTAVRGLDERGVTSFLDAPPAGLRSVGVRAGLARASIDDIAEASRSGSVVILEGLAEDERLRPGHGLRTLSFRRRRDRAPEATADLLARQPRSVTRVVLFKTRDLIPPPQSWLSFERDGSSWSLHAKTYGADGARMLLGGELDGVPLTAARLDVVGDDGGCAAQLERLRPWMVLPERAPCPFTIWRIGHGGPVPDAATPWHARPVEPHPPWLVGPAPIGGRRLFP